MAKLGLTSDLAGRLCLFISASGLGTKPGLRAANPCTDGVPLSIASTFVQIDIQARRSDDCADL